MVYGIEVLEKDGTLESYLFNKHSKDFQSIGSDILVVALSGD